MQYEIRYKLLAKDIPGSEGVPVRNLEPRESVYVCTEHGFRCDEWAHPFKKVSNEILPAFSGEHQSLDGTWWAGLYLAEDLFIVPKAA